MFCFKREQRLLKKTEFDSVFADGKKISTLGIVLYAKKTDNPLGRMGMVVAKRQFKRAVKRNQLKRQLRESFRHQVFDHVDVVVVLYKPVADLTNAVMQERLGMMWQKLQTYLKKRQSLQLKDTNG